MTCWQLFCVLSLALLLDVTNAADRNQKGPRGQTRTFRKKSQSDYNGSNLPTNRRVHLKIMGQSGKFSLSRNADPSADNNRIDVSFDELGEVDSVLNPVGRTGSSKHYFQSFATLDFYFTDFQNGSYQDVIVDEMFFTADLTSINANAKFIVTVIVFKEDGNITVDGESTEVKQGDVKLNFFLENWVFCENTACRHGQTNEIGSYVRFVYTQRSKGRPQKRGNSAKRRKTGGDEYDLGGDGILILSKKVEVDGVLENMKAGYPKYEEQGGKQRFIFLFPKFSSNMTYDPTYAASVSDPDSQGNRGEMGPVVMVSMICMTWALAVTMTRV